MARVLTRLWAATALVVFALGVAVLPLQLPSFTRTLSARYSLHERAGLEPERMAQVAEQVRAYVVDGEGILPNTVEGRDGFDAEAVSHLDDVRAVLRAARFATLLLGTALAAWFVAGVRRDRFGELANAFAAGAAGTAALPVLGAVVAVLDFDRFFAVFHSLMFAAGTWVFPYDSLLILTFPEPFWVACGVAWALLTAVAALVFGVCAMACRRREGDLSTTPCSDERAREA